MQTGELKAVEIQLDLISKRIDDGFRSIEKRLDEISDNAGQLETRVRDLEIHGSVESVRRMIDIERGVAEMQKDLSKAELEHASERTKMRWLISIIGFAATTLGGLVVRLIG